MRIGACFVHLAIVACALLLPRLALATASINVMPSERVQPLNIDYRAIRVVQIALFSEQRTGRAPTITQSLLEGAPIVEPRGKSRLPQPAPSIGESPSGVGNSIGLSGSGKDAVSLEAIGGVTDDTAVIPMAQPVPEPSSWMLLLAGALLMGSVVRRCSRLFS